MDSVHLLRPFDEALTVLTLLLIDSHGQPQGPQRAVQPSGEEPVAFPQVS